MRTSTVVVTGVDPHAIDRTMLGLSWDLPRAVAVRHRIDPASQVLTRVVSDASGVLEHAEVELEHACVSCALREDILPTLERLGRDGRWSSIVAGLPTGTEAVQLARALARDSSLARHLRLSSVVAVTSTDRVTEDLLGDDLLRERGWHTGPGDGRGVGEVACAQVEYADVVVLADDTGAEATDLARALARPEALLVPGADQLDVTTLLSRSHVLTDATGWSSALRDEPRPPLGDSQAWRLELSTPRALHPERLLDHIERLGSGRHRSRGCFWVPTRPGLALEWGGAGGQLSIGVLEPWDRRPPVSRLLFTGLGRPPRDLVEAFEGIALTPQEARLDPRHWHRREDGLEAWLGEIRDAA